MLIQTSAVATMVWAAGPLASAASLEAPRTVPQFGVAEFVIHVSDPPFGNPFTDVEVTGTFKSGSGPAVLVRGFADSQDGSVLRLRFCPQAAPAAYSYELDLSAGEMQQRFTGTLTCEPSGAPGPVIVDPEHPKHFIRAGSHKPFYHLGHTAYHLLDPSNTDEDIDGLIRYCSSREFNKIRFLLTGYPRDMVSRTSADPEYGVADPWKAPNYGAKAGEVNPLPAWLGEPHHYDFARFNVAHWQRVDRVVQRMREAGIVATCIFTIEKQDLPKEYGGLTEAEYRLYRYAVARLAAFDNVWWDLGNEHNEFRDARWGNTMGAFVKSEDPYDRLLSAHGYSEFRYPQARWADFIITQQYGVEKEVHDWVLKYLSVRKPYVNEEYGYEGRGKTKRQSGDEPVGHGQPADQVRRSHWSVAMAGGYATYGDASDGVAWFYMGEPGPGAAAQQLKWIRRFFEALPFHELAPHDELIRGGFCLAEPPEHYVFYLPRGGTTSVKLSSPVSGKLSAEWYDPRTGARWEGPAITQPAFDVTGPSEDDWVLHVHSGKRPDHGGGAGKASEEAR